MASAHACHALCDGVAYDAPSSRGLHAPRPTSSRVSTRAPYVPWRGGAGATAVRVPAVAIPSALPQLVGHADTRGGAARCPSSPWPGARWSARTPRVRRALDTALLQDAWAMVEVTRDASAHSVCLCIRALATGHHLSLDPLERAALTRALSHLPAHRTVAARMPVMFPYLMCRCCLRKAPVRQRP